MIEELLEQWKSPRSLVVVSSDHRVQRAARGRGATFIDSEVWYADLRKTRRKRKSNAEEVALKPTDKLSPDEVAHWLAAFSDGPAVKPSSDNPFPPGYADDIAEDS
jgi:uncharacterized protein